MPVHRLFHHLLQFVLQAGSLLPDILLLAGPICIPCSKPVGLNVQDGLPAKVKHICGIPWENPLC